MMSIIFLVYLVQTNFFPEEAPAPDQLNVIPEIPRIPNNMLSDDITRVANKSGNINIALYIAYCTGPDSCPYYVVRHIFIFLEHHE